MTIGKNHISDMNGTIDVNEQSNPGRQLYTLSVNTTRRPELSRSFQVKLRGCVQTKGARQHLNFDERFLKLRA